MDSINNAGTCAFDLKTFILKVHSNTDIPCVSLAGLTASSFSGEGERSGGEAGGGVH